MATLGNNEAMDGNETCAAGRHVTRRVEAARARVVDETVLETVNGVALVHDFLCNQRQHRGRDRRLGQRLLVPHRADGEAGLIDPRRVGDDAVEVVGITLRLEQALTAAVRTGVPVGEADRLRVVLGRDLLRGLGSDMHRAIRVVDRLLLVAQDERAARLVARVVAGVRPCHHKAVGQRRRSDRDCSAHRGIAGEPAVAGHVEAAIPAVGQTDLERDFRRDDARDPAMLWSVR